MYFFLLLNCCYHFLKNFVCLNYFRDQNLRNCGDRLFRHWADSNFRFFSSFNSLSFTWNFFSRRDRLFNRLDRDNINFMSFFIIDSDRFNKLLSRFAFEDQIDFFNKTIVNSFTRNNFVIFQNFITGNNFFIWHFCLNFFLDNLLSCYFNHFISIVINCFLFWSYLLSCRFLTSWLFFFNVDNNWLFSWFDNQCHVLSFIIFIYDFSENLFIVWMNFFFNFYNLFNRNFICCFWFLDDLNVFINFLFIFININFNSWLFRSKNNFLNWFNFQIDNCDFSSFSIVADFNALTWCFSLGMNVVDSISSLNWRWNDLNIGNIFPIWRNMKPLVWIFKNFSDFFVSGLDLCNTVRLNNNSSFSNSFSHIVRFNLRFDNIRSHYSWSMSISVVKNYNLFLDLLRS